MMFKPETEPSLAYRVTRGGLWVFALNIFSRILGLVRMVILARILAPYDFGLMGIALLAMAVLETFSQTGFFAALIQRKDDIKPYLDTVWTILIIRGFILFVILYLIAPFVAVFFKVSQAKFIIQVMGLSILFQAFTNIGVLYFQKDIEFNKQFVYQLSGTLADFITAISAAIIFKDVWALVFGLLARDFIKLIVSYKIHPYRPRIDFNFKKTKELFKFGKWVLGSYILALLLTEGDDAFVGKFLGATFLGFYQLAYIISNTPATEITHIISQVTFPAYSKFRDNIVRLKEAYLKVLKITAFLSLPIGGLIFVLAGDFTKIFLGEKWLLMVPAIQVLVFAGLLRSIGATTGAIFYSVGKPEILTKLQFAQTIIMMILLYPLTAKMGIVGASLSVVLAAIIPNLIACFIAIKIIDYRVGGFFRLIFLPLISTLIAILFVLMPQVIGLFPNLSILKFASTIIFYCLICGIIYYLFDKFLNYNIRTLIKEVVLNLVSRT